MDKTNSYDSKLSQARGLASQLGMFAEENDIPKDLWDSLESTIYDFYNVSNEKQDLVRQSAKNQEIFDKNDQ